MRPALPVVSAKSHTRRPTCGHCLRPQSACLCRWIAPTASEVSLLILQHPAEQFQAKGSARLLQLSLDRCQCEVGERFDAAALAVWLAAPTPHGPARSLLLYPADAGGQVPAGAPVGRLPQPATWRLVLLDGTWRQTRRMLQAHPLLQSLPRWPLPSPPPSRYAIRKAQRPEQRSTLEAACLALGVLEGQPDRYAGLLSSFDAWVAATAARAAAAPTAA